MNQARSFAVLFLLAGLSVLALGMISNVRATTSQYRPHSPILIVGNGGFTPANGVTGGSGTVYDPYVISGWNITSSTSNGIEIRNTTANFVARNLSIDVQGANNGTLFYNVQSGSLENSTITDYSSSWGVRVIESRNVNLSGNEVNPQISSGGVVDIYGEGATVSNSTNVTLNGDNFSGLYQVLDISTSTIVRVQNTITNSESSNGGSIYNSAHVTITKSQFWNGFCDIGLSIASSRDVSVTSSFGYGGSCGAGSGSDGFYGYNDQNLTLSYDSTAQATLDASNLTVTSLDANLLTVTGSNITLTSNTLQELDASGSNIHVLNNNVNNSFNVDNYYGCSSNPWPLGGLSVSGSKVTVQGNTISWTCNGLTYSGVTNGVVTENLIANSTYGIILHGSTGVSVFHNNVVNNTLQASDDKPGANMWDAGYPLGGNFWSNYHGVDNCSGPQQNACSSPDGIGDTPYVFNSGRDNYPLMKPYLVIDPPISGSVGGTEIPINRVGLLFPYLAMVVLAVSASIIYLIRRKSA